MARLPPPDMASGHAAARTLRRTKALLLGAGQILGESAAGKENAVFAAHGTNAAELLVPVHIAGAPAAMDATAPRPKELEDAGRSEAHEIIMAAEIIPPPRMEIAEPGRCDLKAVCRAFADKTREQRQRPHLARALVLCSFGGRVHFSHVSALETTQGQMDRFCNQLTYKYYWLDEVASLGD